MDSDSIDKVKRLVVVTQQIQRNVLIVLQVGHHLKAVQNVKPVKLELSATSKVKSAITAAQDSIVQVKKVMVSPLQIQRLVLTVR